MNPILKAIFILLIFSSKIFVCQIATPNEIVIHENSWTSLPLPSNNPIPKVNLSFSFNVHELIINADVKDNHFKDGERSWRHGDGFYINFVTPDKNETETSNKFYGFGFSIEKGKPVSVLVNKDGNYFPEFEAPPTPEIFIDSTNKTAHYKIKIPWSNVYPFHPVKNSIAGINIVYISQNDDGSRIIQKLVEDDYDTERTNFRRFLPIKFSFAKKHNNFMTGEINERVTNSRKNFIELFVRSTKKVKSKISVVISSNGIPPIKKTFTKNLVPGINRIKYSLKLPKNNGLYTITAILNDTTKWDDDIYKYGKDSFEQSSRIIRLLTETTQNEEIKLSGQTIIYHVNELEKSINNFSVRDNILGIKNKFEILSALMNQFTSEKTIFKNSGYILCAFNSTIDSTLQPFSVMLPENIDINRKYNLMIVLHGSGVDEIKSIKNAAKNFNNKEYIFIAPRGRDLSSWYVGYTEKDIVQLTVAIKKLFNVDKTILYGFSMGGYGSWRYGLLYPDLFDAGIIISGIPFNYVDENPEYDMNNFLGDKESIPFLVVHGTKDRSLNISHTEKFVEKLKSAGHKIDFIKIDGGGHGDFDSASLISDWLYKNNLTK